MVNNHGDRFRPQIGLWDLQMAWLINEGDPNYSLSGHPRRGFLTPDLVGVEKNPKESHLRIWPCIRGYM